jgi:AcrR family transcriptional regulator
MTGPQRRRPSRAETRRRIIDAATTVFARQSIAATSLNDIAAEAGLTKGAVYSNFAGRDVLKLLVTPTASGSAADPRRPARPGTARR